MGAVFLHAGGFSTASCPAQFSSSSTSVWCCIQGPFNPSVQLSLPYNLTEQEPLAGRLVGKGPLMKEAGRYHIEAAWNGKQFRVKIYGLAFQTCNVKPSVVSLLPPAHGLLFFAQEMIASMRSATSSISPSVQPLCPLCAFDNQQVLWSDVTCCLLCYTCFCSNHAGACGQ